MPDRAGRAFSMVVRAGRIVQITLNEVRTRLSTVDRAKLTATTDDDVRLHKADDGYANLRPPEAVNVVYPFRSMREQLGLT